MLTGLADGIPSLSASDRSLLLLPIVLWCIFYGYEQLASRRVEQARQPITYVASFDPIAADVVRKKRLVPNGLFLLTLEALSMRLIFLTGGAACGTGIFDSRIHRSKDNGF